ncbi:hypothetical protein [Mesonia aestuariivivens]|uniref:Phosphopeptide-binding protein n=1 Tax=Mesonia aestuariivivens TaxID=2796128 RepID=A0ABS6W102_9FLAO|nr:hypothetical protein [Mesonia aestuariivivens]MBW2961429.1 hypothetical protein [Mesonia aestuariivivens]
MKKISLIIASAMVIAATSCKENKKEAEKDMDNETKTEETSEMEAKEITLSPLENSPAYENSSLSLIEPKKEMLTDGKQVKFEFDVKNYDLGVQTEGAKEKMMANSGKGQHIHFIMDNDPYSAHYEPNFNKDIEPGNHLLVAFLSRSYHESVKNANSFVVKKLTIGDAKDDELGNVDITKPHMIYSRPKGTYTGKDTEKVMLDFFLLNTDLSASGNKVKATINDQEFMLDTWEPKVIEGLPMGENTIKLELLDKDGNLVESPFNPVTRTVTLEE